jgi:hypothetical protein
MRRLQLAGLGLWLALPRRRCGSSVRIDLFSGLRGFCHFPELLVDLAGPFAGTGELIGLGERCANALVCVDDFAMGVLNVGDRARLALLQALEAVFQPGDEPGRIGVGQLAHG